MRKLATALLLLAAIGVIAALVVTYTSNGHTQIIVSPVNGTSDTLKEQVMSVALNDSVLKHIVNDSYSQAQVDYIQPGDTGLYIKDRKRYAGVSVNANGGGEPLHFTVVVDTVTMREMSMRYSGVPPLANSWVIIPPENGIYEMMSGGYDLSSPRKYAVPVIGAGFFNVNLTPADAKLYPLILDENNFGQYLNGSSYEVPDLIDMDTGETVRIDGSVPVTAGWKSQYILPEARQSYNVNSPWATWYYLLLLNKDSNTDIKVIYRMPFPTIYGD
jgi:hypothetical protein